mmetsp:Transcript_28825/g.72401  ORF Transcript_28825/g.72401 Transcript_28825/m.72401 type:complete len:338 (-) Transcript_28825:424-1437(-)|eukprot:CAMPEP_0179894462 /NCGR_PEP_ID=MMETSP0982-20121206/35300_1 /TAXON_ID=483367 /ORGANISM="non described non described, Strain CCMP 2436" /LENGTH=337 /DNA_ID=CAMNT_0021791057 /DNA_START=1 /DNA_END=1014 /DNA_ORIENTATION=+
MYTNSEHHLDEVYEKRRPTAPMPTPPADASAHLSTARRMSNTELDNKALGSRHSSNTEVYAPLGGRRSSRAEEYSGSAGAGLTGISVASLVQDNAHWQIAGTDEHDNAARAQSIFDAKEKAAEPATTGIARARANSRAEVNVRRSREASRDLSSYVGAPSQPLGLSARIAADLGVDNSAPQPHQEPKDETASLTKEHRSSRDQVDIAREHARAAAAMEVPKGLGSRRSTRDELLHAGGASSGALPQIAQSMSQLLSAELAAVRPIQQPEPEQNGEKDGADTEPRMSAIDRARRINLEASIARGDAPKRRPSRDVSDYINAGGEGISTRPTVSELLGH